MGAAFANNGTKTHSNATFSAKNSLENLYFHQMKITYGIPYWDAIKHRYSMQDCCMKSDYLFCQQF